MEVFAVTVFVSLMFAVLFATLFLAERSQRRCRSLEQDALLPLDDGPGPQRVRGLETRTLAVASGLQNSSPAPAELERKTSSISSSRKL